MAVSKEVFLGSIIFVFFRECTIVHFKIYMNESMILLS